MQPIKNFNKRTMIVTLALVTSALFTTLLAYYIQNNKTNIKQQAQTSFTNTLHLGIDALQQTQTPVPNTIIAPNFLDATMGQVVTTSFNNSGVSITWTTDEPAKSQIEYGSTTSYGLKTSLTSSLAVSHEHILTGLTPGGIYHYRIIATDASGNTTTSTDRTFTTITDTTNTQPAKIAIKQVNHINNNLNISYTSTGNHTEAHHAHFQLDNNPEVMDMSLDGNYELVNVTPGEHTLTGFLVRRDHTTILGSEHVIPINTSAGQPTVIFNEDKNPPTIIISTPSNAAKAVGAITISANAADDTGIQAVQFYIDNAPIGGEITTAPYATSWDSFAVSNGSHNITAKARDAAGNQTMSNPVTVTVENDLNASKIGKWSGVMTWPLVAVHATLMYTGEILMWDGWETPTTKAVIWNPATQQFTSVPFSNGGLFCSGHTVLPDGRVLVTGGHSETGVGIKTVALFNPASKSWSLGAPMNYARWYPTITTLPNGKVVIVSGKISMQVFADTPEVYDPALNKHTQLTSIKTTTLRQTNASYPLNFPLPNGKIASISLDTRAVQLLDVNAQTWTQINKSAVLNGAAVQYQPGKILMTGGGTTNGNSQTTASVLDLNNGNTTWRSVSPMKTGRYLHNFAVLPDGKVLTVGGAATIAANSTAGVLSTELWDPSSEAWTTVASMQKPRMYHSISLLLPDGRVLSAGGGKWGGTPTMYNQTNAQIYSPSYLFKGERPTITSAPSGIQYGTNIKVQTPNAANISKISLISLPSVTHTINMNQLFSQLTFQKGQNELTVQAPSSANTVTPGYYMMFLIDANGIPSVAKIIKLSGGASISNAPQPTSTQAPSQDTTPPALDSIKTTLNDNRIQTLAYTDPASNKITIGGKNTSTETFTLYGSIANLPTITKLQFYQTDSTGNLTSKADVTVTNGIFSIQVAPESTFTLTSFSPDIIWTNKVNVTATGSTLTKTGGTNGKWDAGATSNEKISSGDGYAQVTITDTIDHYRMFGLNHNNTTASYTDMDYALYFRANAELQIYENGSHKLSGQTYALGDTFTIAVVSNAARYYKNGVLFYVSPQAPVYPLFIDVSLQNSGAQFSAAKLASATYASAPINIALKKIAKASSTYSTSYTAAKAFDGSLSTRWNAARGKTSNQWLSVDFGATKTYNNVIIREITAARVKSHKLQYSNDGVNYTDIPGTTGTTIGSYKFINFAPITSRHMRAYFSSSSPYEPTINEIVVY